MKYFMVFDVESIGLHGEGFAVAWVVIDREGAIHEEALYVCPREQCQGTDGDREWVEGNVPELEVTCATKDELYSSFWRGWRDWQAEGAILVADCGWPVEANFLSACVRASPERRGWKGPYPLHELASILLACGQDPLAHTARQPDELPEHHPLGDAKHSARQLIAMLNNTES
jgi:hypothetical protein